MHLTVKTPWPVWSISFVVYSKVDLNAYIYFWKEIPIISVIINTTENARSLFSVLYAYIKQLNTMMTSTVTKPIWCTVNPSKITKINVR